MVKAELTIEIQKDDKLHIALDLLKREDAKIMEWQIAEVIQELLLSSIKIMTKEDPNILLKQEIIKGT